MTHGTPALEPTQPALERGEAAGLAKEELPPTVIGAAVDQAAAIPSVEGAPRASLQPLLVTAVLSLVAYLLLAVPLVFSIRSSLWDESLARGRALVDLLAAHNETALAAGENQALSVESVSNRPGVEDALVLDMGGHVLAPGDRSGGAYETIEGTAKKVSEIGDFFQGRTSAGDYVLVKPLTRQGERIGFVVLRYSGVAVAERKTVPVLLFLGFLLIVGGAWGAYLLSQKPALELVATETTLAENPEPTLTDF
jgi:hypothetical protein